MTVLTHGRAGLRELLARLRRWRVGVRWYTVALLPVLVMAVTCLGLSLLSPEFVPAIFSAEGKAGILLSAVAASLLFGVFEEVGWTGFAVPRLRSRYAVVTTGLTVGLVWGAWHFPLFWESSTFSGALPLAVLLARLFSWLPAYRVLMVWVYDRTGSLLVAVLMHASVTTSEIITAPLTLAGVPLLTSILVGSAAWWAVVAAVMLANRVQISRQPLRRQMA